MAVLKFPNTLIVLPHQYATVNVLTGTWHLAYIASFSLEGCNSTTHYMHTNRLKINNTVEKVSSLTHSVLFVKCDLIQNKLKVEQIVHSWELYTVYNFSVCVCKLFCILCPFSKSSQ